MEAHYTTGPDPDRTRPRPDQTGPLSGQRRIQTVGNFCCSALFSSCRMEKISFSEYAFLKFYIFAAPYSVIWIKSSQLAAQKVNKTERGVSKKENEKGKLWTKTSVIFSCYFDGSSVKMHNMHQVKTEFKNEKMHKETRAYIWLYLTEWNRNSSCQHSRFSAALVTVSLDYVTPLKICKGLKKYHSV